MASIYYTGYVEDLVIFTQINIGIQNVAVELEFWKLYLVTWPWWKSCPKKGSYGGDGDMKTNAYK